MAGTTHGSAGANKGCTVLFGDGGTHCVHSATSFPVNAVQSLFASVTLWVSPVTDVGL